MKTKIKKKWPRTCSYCKNESKCDMAIKHWGWSEKRENGDKFNCPNFKYKTTLKSI